MCSKLARRDHAGWRTDVYKRLAFLARYASTSPADAADWDLRDLMGICEEVAQILREENKRRPA